MAFFIASFEWNKTTWMSLLLGGAIAVLSIFIAYKMGSLDALENFFDILFWISFFFWWGIIGFVVVQWIFQKIFSS